MKKFTLCTIALICLRLFSNAQIIKGSTFLGGSLSFNSSSSKNENTSTQESKSSGWNINPQFGKAVATNKIVGLFLTYGHSKNESGTGTSLQQTLSSLYGGGVFYRNYFPLSARFYLFGEGTIGLGISNDEQKLGNIQLNKTDRTTVSFGITPGISFAAARKLHLEASLNSLASIYYQSAKQKNYSSTGTIVNTTLQKQFGLAANANGFSNISIGLRWILPAKN